MRRTRTEDVAETARRRLELLEAELAGLQRPDARPFGDVEEERSVPHTVDEDRWLPAAVVEEPGRHARRSTPVSRGVQAIADRLPDGLRGRVRLGRGHLAWLGALAAIAVAITGWWAWQTPDTTGEPVQAVRVRAPAAAPSVTAPSAAPAASGEQLVVDVAGKVRRPGVLTLPAGSRVHEAIERAGGPRRGVDLSALNLARPLVDGEQVLVGVAPAPGAAAAAVGGAPAGALVNLNTATAEQLEELPGVGPVTAESILAWRTANGAFSSVDELLEVDGIGEKTLADIAPHVTL
ncbi:hypothetical protein GCM10027425_07630 [Alteromonas gracilis]